LKIGIIDSDLINHKTNFPNLALMKISNYYKNLGNDVELILNYDKCNPFFSEYDKIFLSKVFSKTNIPEWILKLKNIEIGGTGLDFTKNNFLNNEIEHFMPDYDLYSNYVLIKENNGGKVKDYYKKYSIGFTTRFCFRKCSFCVNKNYNKVEKWSNVDEFLDDKKDFIILLDDNIFGYKDYQNIFESLNHTGKKFEFKQGLDIRLLNDEKCNVLINSNYNKTFIFAFDDLNDKEMIIEKMKLLRKYYNGRSIFYLLCAYKSLEINDIIELFERLKILMIYDFTPYIMLYENYKNSEFKILYYFLKLWCNNVQGLFFKQSFFDLLEYQKGKRINKFEYDEIFKLVNKYNILKHYFKLKHEDYCIIKRIKNNK
jgi:sulfur relay (sulfurtransferase) DsrF/TusC family protein